MSVLSGGLIPSFPPAVTHPVVLCSALQHQLVSTPSPLPPLLQSPAWLAGSAMLLSFSSTPPLSVPLQLPFPVLDTLASSVSLCNAASLQQAWGLLDQSPLSSPPLCLTQSTLYGLIYLPSLPPLSSPYSEAELLTSCRVHDHSWAGSLRQTAVENRYMSAKATVMAFI